MGRIRGYISIIFGGLRGRLSACSAAGIGDVVPSANSPSVVCARGPMVLSAPSSSATATRRSSAVPSDDQQLRPLVAPTHSPRPSDCARRIIPTPFRTSSVEAEDSDADPRDLPPENRPRTCERSEPTDSGERRSRPAVLSRLRRISLFPANGLDGVPGGDVSADPADGLNVFRRKPQRRSRSRR